MTSLWPHTSSRIFIDLQKENNCPEASYTHSQMSGIFGIACHELSDIFVDFNNKYKLLAEQDLNNLKNTQANECFKSLIQQFNLIMKAMYIPYKKPYVDNLSNVVDYLTNICPPDVDEQEFYNQNLFFKNIGSINLVKYAKFLSVFAKQLQCYVRLYYENLNKKYYFKFEHLVRGKYKYMYFECKQNEYLLNLDNEIIEICDKHCKSLNDYLKQFWG